MLKSTRGFRFGIGSPARSLTFKIERDKHEVYIFCREHPNIRHSLHSSGIHRYAVQSKKRRKAIESTTLTNLVRGYYVTVARVIFTTETDWSVHRALSEKKYISLPQPEPTHLAMLSIGITPHHPSASEHTDLPENIATLKVHDEKYITATLSIVPKKLFIRDLVTIHTPHRDTNFVTQSNETHSIVQSTDKLIHFRTKMNTLVYWAHHNMRDVDARSRVFIEIARQIEQAHQMSIAGINFGERGVDFTNLQPR